MKINRIELLALLKALIPAVAGQRNQMQELSCIWFTGVKVAAFNDVLGIEIDFETEFTGGVLGEKLIGVLERSRAKEVTVEIENDEALFKIGAARIKLGWRPIEDWFWEPQVPDGDGFALTDEMTSAIKTALISVGVVNVLNPEQRGVTVIQNGKMADLYATDAVSLSWVQVKGEMAGPDSRIILPTPFCECITRLKEKAELRFDDNAVYCTTGLGSKEAPLRRMLVFSRLVEDDDPVSFKDVVSQYVNGDDGGVEIPKQLKLRAERAMVLLSDQPIELSVEDSRLYLYAQTPFGEVDDVLPLEGHQNVNAKVDIALIHRVLDSCDRITVAENGVVLTGPNSFTHIVATK